MAELIVAIDQKYGIGYYGILPWKCKEEMNLFKTITMGKTLVMGRNTYNSIPGGTLGGRSIAVVTKYTEYSSTCTRLSKVTDVTTVIPEWKTNVIFAGGPGIYESAVRNGLVQTVHLSVMNVTYACDTFFDKNLLNNFVVIFKQEYTDFTYYKLVLTNNGERQYLDLIDKVVSTGEHRIGRNGGTRSIFKADMTWDLRNGFPLLTTKRMFIKGIIEELLFFLRGDTDTTKLEKLGVNIWKGNTSREFLDSLSMTTRRSGLMGPMYGYQFRFFGAEYDEDNACPIGTGVDQLKYVVNNIRTNPTSRRILMTSFNPAQVDQGVLYPCHSLLLQFYVSDEYLDMLCVNRSQDLFLGVPFNIASSSLMLMIVAKITGKVPRYFHMTMGDVHIYDNHVEQALEQLGRIPYQLPTIKLPDISSIDDLNKLTSADFLVENYSYHPSIKADMVV